MKATHFALLVGVCLLIVMGRPHLYERQFENPGIERQEEEAFAEEEMVDEKVKGITLDVRYQIQNPKDEALRDILWLKRAAEVALENGTPYFYVIEQKSTKEFSRKNNTELSIMEGVIELESDPMAAEYDAHEILSLVLTDHVDL